LSARATAVAGNVSSLEVDYQLELSRLFDRDVGDLDAVEELDKLSGSNILDELVARGP
jgi:hypothetical protein